MAAEVVFPNLGIELARLPRVAVTLFGLDIYWYGICIVTGILVGLMLAVNYGKKLGQNTELYTDFLFFGLITSIIGARLYYVLFSWDSYKNNLWKILAFREGGLAIYGGIIAAVITAYIFAKVKKMDFLLFADIAAPSLLMGQVIGRWGNLFNREVFGGYTDSLFAMRYLTSQVDVIPQSVMDKIVTVNGFDYIQVHPTFLYESLWNLCLFFILVYYRPHKKFKGEILLLYFLGHGIGRTWIEGIRTDQLILFNTGIPVSQLLSVILVVVSLVILIICRKKNKGRQIEI